MHAGEPIVSCEVIEFNRQKNVETVNELGVKRKVQTTIPVRCFLTVGADKRVVVTEIKTLTVLGVLGDANGWSSPLSGFNWEGL